MAGGVVLEIKHYEVTIETLGPVHIGSGKTIEKKDYFIVESNTYILDTIRFFKKLTNNHKALYESFLENSYSNLTDFLLKNNLTSLAMTCVSYSISGFKPEQKGSENIYHNVSQFLRDGQGDSYIPGSTLKGVIRTIILGYIISHDATGYSALINSTTRDYGSRRLEDKAFKLHSVDNSISEEVSDNLMKYISISDSKPLSNDDLIFAKKFDLFSINDPKNRDKYGNELNIYKECIKIGTKICFRMDIDESQFDFSSKKGRETLSSTTLMNLIKDSYWHYKNHFLNHFKVLDDNIENIVYLGGGTGFPTKTVNIQLYKHDVAKINANILYRQFPTKISDNYKYAESLRSEVRNAGFIPEQMFSSNNRKKNDHRHWQYRELKVSPHTLKCTKISGKIYEFGKCTIQIEELKKEN